MKKRALIFVCVAFLALAIVPAINLKLGNVQNKLSEIWANRYSLYKLDFTLPYVGRFFYPFGISIQPNQVLIGKNDWLFLGDKYATAITVKRRRATAEDMETAKKIAAATKSWEQWLKLHGVRLY